MAVTRIAVAHGELHPICSLSIRRDRPHHADLRAHLIATRVTSFVIFSFPRNTVTITLSPS